MKKNKFNYISFFTSIFSGWISKICFIIYLITGSAIFLRLVNDSLRSNLSIPFILAGIICSLTFSFNLISYLLSTHEGSQSVIDSSNITMSIISGLYFGIILGLLLYSILMVSGYIHIQK